MFLKKISSIILILAMSAPSGFSFANEPEASTDAPLEAAAATETIEVAATEVRICCDGDAYKISLQVKNGPEYLLDGAPYTYQNESAFLSLSDAKKEKFLSIRSRYLGRTAAVLHSTRIVYGVGSLVKDKISHTFSKMFSRTKSFFSRPAVAAKPIEDLAIEIARSEMQNEETSSPRFRERVRLRSHEVILQVLKNIDRKLWDQSGLVVDKNETHLKVSIGGVGINAVGFKGKGWGSAIGIHLGYNSSLRAFVFEFYPENEKTLVAYTPTLLYALAPKLGITFSKVDIENPAMRRTGESFYTPGAPLYFTTMENTFSAGLNSSIIGTPGGDAFAYLNTVTQHILLRVTISPFQTGFVRWHLGSMRAKKSCSEQLK